MVRHCHVVVALLIALVATPAAAGGMNRCLGADGKISYSDRACPTGQLSAGQVDRSGVRLPTKDEAAALKKASATSPARPAGPAEKLQLDMAGPSLVATACSVLVVQCVQPPDKTLDGCFAAAPRCTSATPWLDGSSLACCPQSCLDQYKGLRRSGKPELHALQQTLGGGQGAGNTCVAAAR
jgi:hypothetical protein